MAFFQQLQQQTERQRQHLLSVPIIRRSLQGDIALDDYVAFLQQAYHHVKHTTPLLMTVGGKLTGDKEWLREAVAEYIAEELGHQEWVLNDIAQCGYDREAARHSQPNVSTELMVAYAYDSIHRIGPLSFFGMVHVLEGTSIALADRAASRLGKALNLPEAAFSYLRSHGSLDVEHVDFFRGLMNRIVDTAEQEQIIHSARVFYRLYGDMFRELSNDHGLPRAA